MVKRGNRLVVEKLGTVIHWVHAFKLRQVVILGNVNLSPGALAFLMQEGIDTVFMSLYGKYRGRLISEFSKNIDLRRAQFRRFEDPSFRLEAAKRFVRGKLENCRVLLRRYNQKLNGEELVRGVHRLRWSLLRLDEAGSVEEVMGLEGAGAAAYFGCFGRLLIPDTFVFENRNRRPPRDPVNVLLSFGYTLLANAIQTQVHVAGLDPYLGCLHGVEYGRPSLVLDLMEEFRPVLVDAVVLQAVNKKILRPTDFYRPEEREPAAYTFAETEPLRDGAPIVLTHQGVKKFIAQFEARLNRKVIYLPTGKRISYRDVCLEQVRMFARSLTGEGEYEPYTFR